MTISAAREAALRARLRAIASGDLRWMRRGRTSDRSLAARRNGCDWHTLIGSADRSGPLSSTRTASTMLAFRRSPAARHEGTTSELQLSRFRERSHQALKRRRAVARCSLELPSLREDRARPNREGPGSVGAGRDRHRLCAVRRASERATGASMAAPGRHRASRRARRRCGRARRRLAVTALCAVHAILTNSVYAAHMPSGELRTRSAWRKAASPKGEACVVLLAAWGTCCSRTSTRVISPGRSREESEGDRRQRDGQGGPSPEELRDRESCSLPAFCAVAMRSQDVRGLRRQGGTLSLRGALVNPDAQRCISFGGLRADQAVGAEAIGSKPFGVDAAVRRSTR